MIKGPTKETKKELNEQESFEVAEQFTHGESLPYIKGFIVWARRNKIQLVKEIDKEIK